MADLESIRKYYTSTQFEYKLMWNWRLKTIPALHFGYYDEKATKHAEAVARANEVLAEWAGIQPHSVMVDAGCGLGQSAIWLSQRYHSKVTGITVVPKQIQTIEERLAKDPEPNVAFVLANYLNMPFADNSLDVVWAVESVCHAPEKMLFYKEAYRVLRPGGKLVMADSIRTERPLPPQKEKLLHEIFGRWAIPDIDTVEEHRRHAQEAGFSSFKNRDVTANVLKSYQNLKALCKRYEWLSWLLYKTKLLSQTRHYNMLGSGKQADAIEQGVFTYQHLVAVK